MLLPESTHIRAGLTFVTLLAVSLLIYVILWILDFGTSVSPLELFTQEGTTATLTGFGEVTVAVLGIAMTVVSIIVELAANRYTPRITELFLRDAVNALVMGYFVVVVVLVLMVDMSLFGPVYPSWMVMTVLFGIVTSLLMLLPYFIYVFEFLSPTHVVLRIERHVNALLLRIIRGRHAVPSGRERVAHMVEQLGDIAVKSVENNDKAIAIATLQALAEVGRGHLQVKPQFPADWFDAEPLVEHDPDFMSFQPAVVRSLTPARTWFEMKVLLQFRTTFNESLHKMPDIAHLVAIYTRRIGVRAAEMRDAEALTLTMKFLNTYLRGAINRGDIRTAYHLLNENRSLAETLVRTVHQDTVVEIAERLKYYGQAAFRANLRFILETAAYDMCRLISLAHEVQAPCHDELLALFLDVDRRPDGGRVQEDSLRGVRKAQLKLATCYIHRADLALAKRIFADMRDEDRTRLDRIRQEMEALETPEYWEVSDRGDNFDYLPPEQRACLPEFFSWFDEANAA